MQSATMVRTAGVSSYFNEQLDLGSADAAYRAYGHPQAGDERSILMDLLNITKGQAQCLHVNDVCFM
ncbi:hypothetical protein [Nocardia alni]|uniref:hypothetical protein n=1 Tax=Nocardia alni TaxID=2815723 RepID=UPI001C238441|nr:hypothetical protein [Nocardia alni]